MTCLRRSQWQQSSRQNSLIQDSFSKPNYLGKIGFRQIGVTQISLS
ncbi:MAG: hypothetical protein MUF49_09055 [Oculatellaceae cyanobacterium Prado106]|nr:hypothetical protein [Oculatellaceae cyanobacterium Prado106]